MTQLQELGFFWTRGPVVQWENDAGEIVERSPTGDYSARKQDGSYLTDEDGKRAQYSSGVCAGFALQRLHKV